MAIEDTIYHLHRALAAGRMGVSEWMRVSAWSFMMPCNEGLTPVVHKDNSRARRGAVHEARACREDSGGRVDNRNLPLIDEYQSRHHVVAFALANGCVGLQVECGIPRFLNERTLCNRNLSCGFLVRIR